MRFPPTLCILLAPPLRSPRQGSQTLRDPKLASVDLLLELLCPVFPSPRRSSPQVMRPSRSPFYATEPPTLIESAGTQNGSRMRILEKASRKSAHPFYRTSAACRARRRCRCRRCSRRERTYMESEDETFKN